MKRITFMDDYSTGASEEIMKSLLEANNDGTYRGYGYDRLTKRATEILKERFKNDNLDIYYISGGTQTNSLFIGSALKKHEAVISSPIGHIYVNEAGTIEASGHKVLSVESKDGKIRIEELEKVLKFHNSEHKVKPKIVYFSNTLENGLIYKKDELKELKKFCEKNNLYLYMDGSRLSSALTSSKNDLKFEDLTKLLDAFYIGGTKNGMLFGEALVIVNDNLKEDFRYHIKQKGALMAKGWIIPAQFERSFRDNHFFELGKHANEMAEKLYYGLHSLGVSFNYDFYSNQLFPIFTEKTIEKLLEKFAFGVWEELSDGNKVVRLITSFKTTEESVDMFLEEAREIYGN